jgi:hypothetical protein
MVYPEGGMELFQDGEVQRVQDMSKGPGTLARYRVNSESSKDYHKVFFTHLTTVSFQQNSRPEG